MYSPGIPQPPSLPKDDQEDIFMNFGSLNTTFNQDHVPFVGVITNIQNTNPCIVTSPLHTLATGDTVTFQSLNNKPPLFITGMGELNGNTYTITVIDASNYSLNGTDATNFTPYNVSLGLGNYSSGSLNSGFHKKITFPYVLDFDPLLANQADALYPKYQNPATQIADIYHQNSSVINLLTHLPFNKETISGKGLISPWGLIFNFGQITTTSTPQNFLFPIAYKSFYTIVGSAFLPGFGKRVGVGVGLNQVSLTTFSAAGSEQGQSSRFSVPIYYLAIGQ